MRTYEGTLSNDRNNNEDQNAPIAAYQRATNSKQSTSSPDEDWQYCSRNVAIYIISDSIVRQLQLLLPSYAFPTVITNCASFH